MAAKSASSVKCRVPQAKPGQLFLLGDEIVLLHELTSTKGRVLTRHGHLKRVRISDLKGPFSGSLSLSASKDELKASLISLDEEVVAIEKDFSLADLWELIISEGDEDYSAEDLTQMWLGSFSTASELAVARLVKQQKVYFTERNLRYTACDEKRVTQILQQQKAEVEKERQAELVLSWFKTDSKPQDELPEYIEPVIQALRDSAVNNNHVSENSMGGRVLKSLALPLEGGAFTLLVNLGIFNINENLLLHQYNIRREFSDECLEAASKIEKKIADDTVLFYDRFREEVEVPVFTIDDFDTMDRDDGLSWEPMDDGSFVVGIHITDVSAFVIKDSVLDKEAFKRASSVYLPDQKHPMLPAQLSGGCLSLLPGDRKRCVSVFLRITASNEIINTRCALTWVKVSRGWTYNEVLDSLENSSETAFDNLAHENAEYDYDSVFRAIRNFADVLFEKRMKNGGTESDKEFEMKVVVSEDSISTWKLPKKCPARTLIAEMAIVTNSIIATTMKEASIPAIYRVQAPAATYDSDSSPFVASSIRGPVSFNKVVIGTKPGPHATLGVDIYTQATSPVRRYSDLLVQRQLAAFLSGVEEESVYTADELESFLDGTAFVRGGIRQIEKWGVRYWLLKYIYSRKEDVFPAVVIEKRREHLIVELSDCMIRGRLFPSAGSAFVKGDPVTVTISEFDPRKGFVRIKEA